MSKNIEPTLKEYTNEDRFRKDVNARSMLLSGLPECITIRYLQLDKMILHHLPEPLSETNQDEKTCSGNT
jgi:hypothetical protein